MQLSGLVTRSQSGFYAVETPQGEYLARLRGRLKRGRPTGDIVAIGDRVEISVEDGAEPMIESVAPRQRALVRRDPRPIGDYEQVLIANPDQALFIFACADPAPRLRMLDRFLVIAEAQDIAAHIVATKVDLVGIEQAKAIFGHYTEIGYPVHYTSISDGAGIEELRSLLQGKVSVLAGPSGAGKTSLMNATQPGLDLRVGDVQQGNRKGRHTTAERLMHKLAGGGYVADTPGLKALALWDIQPEELDGYFPEIKPLIHQCRYRACRHIEEPGCAVIEAAQTGKIHMDRYESYLALRQGSKE
ncbi:MAG: ribosome small subunit-dependent GTPase A [Anaerolineales bacterium]|nr:ribosome small subunit-dependent GTPase A [Anaerolineales bacterium]